MSLGAPAIKAEGLSRPLGSVGAAGRHMPP
jgi:hypothetical protein